MDRLEVSEQIEKLRNIRDYRQFSDAVNLIADVLDDLLSGVIDAENKAEEAEDSVRSHELDHEW